MQIDKSAGTSGPDQNSTRQQDNAASQNITEDEASRFSRQLEKKDKRDKARSDRDEQQKLESLFAERSRQAREVREQHRDQERDQGQGGEPQMEMAFAQYMQDSQVKADMQMKAVQQGKSIKEVEAALQKMADQIQVSARDAINGAEIRIAVKDAVLSGTEVRIQRHGGELTVTMNTTSAETHNLLAQHEASLQKHLNDRFGQERVQVNLNRMDNGADQQDGRSKNPYSQADDPDDNRDSV